ncbi:nuclear transport factor 2 family protein [Chitinophagaceae bacterium MMS25-I14]
MKLPGIISALVAAQNGLNATAYAGCFTADAVVLDEGKVHTGKTAIKAWIEDANEKYHTAMKPLSLEQTGANAVLTTELSGTFPGSPIVLQYHFELEGELIRRLEII